ncbi:MAG: site-specific integrase [Acidimicrobiales bacterium]
MATVTASTIRSKRRRQGDGSIYRRQADGRWVGSVQLHSQDGHRRRKVVYGKSEAEVVGKVRQLNFEISRGLPTPNSRITVEELLRRWLSDVVPGRVSASTLRNYRIVCERHVIPVLGSKRLIALTPTDVQVLLSQKQESRLPRPVSTRRGVVERSTAGGYSPCTVKLIRGVLGQAVGQAERWGMVARNVVALTEGPRVAPSESRTLTPQQARALLDAANGERLEAAFVLLLCLGLRKGEVFSLRWADIDFDNSVVTVGPTVSRVENSLVVGSPRTAKSRREANLPRQVVSALSAHQVRQSAERLLARDAWHDNGLVFTTETGGPIDPTNFRRIFDRVTKKARLSGWQPRELRRSCASILRAQGVSSEIVARVLGYSSTRFVDDHGQILDPQPEQVAEAMSAAIWGE